MSNSYRIRTQVGVDKFVQVKLDQDFEQLDILSFSIFPNDIYTRNCPDFGVVCGRVFCNKGFGLPNARLSIFIPISDEDELNPIISTLYPYKSFEDFNEDGYKYNLLPYTKSHSGHVPVGTFPEREDVLIDSSVIEVYDKYYKFTVKTNDSGDFMIFGVPVGQHNLFMQIDLSDIGEFSLTPQDLIRIGRATEGQVNGATFKFSENYSELPQIVTLQKIIQVAPFYGQPDVCDYYIVRADFDLTSEAQIKLEPTAVFMGSLVSTNDRKKIKRTCKIPSKAGWLCDLIAGPGQIETVRQTVNIDSDGRPILEQFRLDNDGKLIDDNGTWVVEVPMNLDYVYTDENGNRLISDDPTIGIPTKGKYRFKIKWQQSPELSEENKRGYFLVPNIKEYGWDSMGSNDPSQNSVQTADITLNSGEGQLIQSLNDLANLYYAININNFQNIQSYEILVNDVVNLDFQTTIPFGTLNPNDDIKIRYTLIDSSTVGTLLNVRLLNEGQWLQQSSYAFSLSWTDYGNDLMINEAINCEDRFYELQYNKVYTVSQLLDRVTQQSFPYLPQKSIQIKHITDSKCEGDYNPFPTNDAYYRYDFLYIALTFILTLLKFSFIPLVVVVHVLAFLWPVFASIVLIIQGIIWLVVQICEGINSVANILGLNFNCPEEPNLSLDIFNNNPFKNIMLPLFLYTDDGCERCRCRIGNVNIEDNDFLDQLRPILSQLNLQNTSSLANLTSSGQYAQGTNNYNLTQQILLAGSRERGVEGGQCFDRLPFYESENFIYNFSTSLPIQERLNLFNTKAKYFDEPGIISPGSTGWNQIKVTWQPDINDPNTNFHFDNTMVLLIDSTGFSRGDIITFQDPSLSNDPNVNVTTGTTNVPNSITVKYANPILGQGASYTTYTISNEYVEQQSIEPQVGCYPSDIEYYQVLDVVDWSTFILNRVGDIQGPNIDDSRFSLPWRFLDTSTVNSNFTNAIQSLELSISLSSLYNQAKYGVLNQEQPGHLDQLNNFSGLTSTKVMILQRGVDVNSPKIKQRIDLSRLYGYSNYNVFNEFFVIEDYFKMNIPIQPGISQDNPSGLVLPRHNEYVDNNTQTFFGYDDIFYESYMFTFSDDYQTGWNTILPNFYSALDRNSIFNSGSWNSGCYGLYPQDIQTTANPINNFENDNQFVIIGGNNYFTKNFISFTSSNGGKCTRCFGDGDPMVADAINFSPQLYNNGDFHYFATTNNFSNGYVSGYKLLEYVEGGSYMVISLPEENSTAREIYSSSPFTDGASCDNGCNGVKSYTNGSDGTTWIQYKKAYVSPVYAAFPNVQPNNTDYVNPNHTITFTNKERIVFRTDRLPSSTTLTTNEKGNGYLLHQNPNFAIFKISNNCTFEQLGGEPTEQIESVEINYDNIPGGEDGPIGQVQNSLQSCQSAVDLNSYDINPETFEPVIYSSPPYSKKDRYLWFVRGSGCYNLVSRPIISLFPVAIPGDPHGRTYSDIALIVEWVQRLKLNFALCFEVFSHTFSNNWINGTLYAYSFQNTTFFDSDNQPFRLYCKNNLYFNDSINNYFYRSSPYDGNNFVGKSINSDYGNMKNLLFPTTILDMGPKVAFIQELVSSDDYDGYVVNQVPTTTFKNVTDILNLFVLSRLINRSFIQLLIPSTADDGNEEGGDDPSVGAFFANLRWKNGDLYASGLLPGVIDADYSQLISINSEIGITEYSPENYSAEGTIFVPDDEDKSVLGLLLTGNTQQRDYISPRRIIWNQNAVIPGNIGDFTYIMTKSQIVPFYQWNIQAQNEVPTIFGYQSNNFVTNINNFFSFKYQELDRFNPSSQYFTPNGNLAGNFRGHIINFDDQGNPTEILPNVVVNPITFGAPYHFYFGLKQGASAMDRFITKYVNTEEVI